MAAATDDYNLDLARYQQGIDPYLDTLLAQRTLYQARQTQASTRLVRADSLVTLYRTLGGDQLIVLSSNGVATWLSSQNGESQWQTNMSDKGYLGPVIADNVLYLLTDDANLSAYR